ncbi:hypothetical protein NEPAR04_2238, partial [Nematocida parisii]
ACAWHSFPAQESARWCVCTYFRLLFGIIRTIEQLVQAGQCPGDTSPSASGREDCPSALLHSQESRALTRAPLARSVWLEMGALSQVSMNGLVDALLGEKLPKHAWRTMFRDFPETKAQCVDRSISITRAVALYLSAINPLRSGLIRPYFISHVPLPLAVKNINLLRPP